jgi:hypothetical protein
MKKEPARAITVAYCLDLVQLFQVTNNRSSVEQNDQKTNDGSVQLTSAVTSTFKL